MESLDKPFDPLVGALHRTNNMDKVKDRIKIKMARKLMESVGIHPSDEHDARIILEDGVEPVMFSVDIHDAIGIHVRERTWILLVYGSDDGARITFPMGRVDSAWINPNDNPDMDKFFSEIANLINSEHVDTLF